MNTAVQEPPGVRVHPSNTSTLRTLTHTIARHATNLVVAPVNLRDISSVHNLLQESGPSIKPRSQEYIESRSHNFLCIKEDNTIIACGEIIELDSRTIELGALATREGYRGRGLSNQIITYAEKQAREQGKSIILVTDNDVLIKQLGERGYTRSENKYPERFSQSPSKQIYRRLFTAE